MLICCQSAGENVCEVDGPATMTRPSAGETTAESGTFACLSGSRKKNRKNAVSASRTMPNQNPTAKAAMTASTRPPRANGHPAGSIRIQKKRPGLFSRTGGKNQTRSQRLALVPNATCQRLAAVDQRRNEKWGG